jgi:hypothetical protein
MKKLLAVVSTFVFTFSSINAQKANFGLKAGYNRASVDIKNDQDFDAKSGIHLGGLVHIHLSDHFAVQPELVFSQQGGQIGGSRLKLAFVNVPVLAQYMINDGFRLQTGPQFGFLVNADQQVGPVEIEVDPTYGSFDFAWSFGAGYVSKMGLGIDARYNHGLTNFSEDGDFEARNRVFQVGLFYQFRNNSGKKK